VNRGDSTPDLPVSTGKVEVVRPGSVECSRSAATLPDFLPSYLEAAGKLASEAAARGDMAAAHRIMEDAVKAVDAASARPKFHPGEQSACKDSRGEEVGGLPGVRLRRAGSLARH
jgi:hypothetical protein